MSFGKGGGTTVTTPELTPEQKAAISAQTGFLTGTIIPTYQQAVGGAKDIYNQGAGGVTNAAQNQSNVAGQIQSTAGETGESALRTGVSGLENLFSNDYMAQQMQTAMQPAEAQYQSNLAGLGATFGGAGQMGSARQALANTQLAGQTQAAQMAAAAGVRRDIEQGRLAAGNSLAGIGQAGLGQALGAAGTRVGAAMAPQDYYNKYASVIFGTPQSSYNPNFTGTQGSTQNKNNYNFGISLPSIG